MIEFDEIQRAMPAWPSPSNGENGFLIGVFPGQGIGLEVIEVALKILRTAAGGTRFSFNIEVMDNPAASLDSQVVSKDVIAFCESIFARGGAVMAGPVGGRVVYDLRGNFDLFCKITPLVPGAALRSTGVIKPEVLEGINILIVRENSGGIYMGQWSEKNSDNHASATHSFTYRKAEALRILRVAFELAANRRRRLTLILKTEGLPSISRVWITALKELAPEWNHVDCEILEVDNAAFQLIRYPHKFDVVVTGNLFGDILSDCGGLLLGSRGLCFSGNFGKGGNAIYQTGHGAAYDIAGRDKANPIGQLTSLSMMLRTSFALKALSVKIERGITKALSDGWRTPDIAGPGSKIVGTRELGRQIALAIENLNS